MKLKTITNNTRLTRWQAFFKSIVSVTVMLCIVLGFWQGIHTLTLWMRMVRPGPTWNGLTVGESTSADVVTVWGTPTSIESAREIVTYTYQTGKTVWKQHQIVLDQNIVEFMVEDTLDYLPRTVMLTDFIAQYGKPDSIQRAKEDGYRIVIFLDNGILAYSTDDWAIEQVSVRKVYYYRPRLLPSVLRDFSRYIYRGPSPICSEGGCRYYGPRDAWYGWFGGPWPEWAHEWLYQ